jgi:hypothetical protein
MEEAARRVAQIFGVSTGHALPKVSTQTLQCYHAYGSAAPSNISGQLHIELRQIEGADCPQLLRQRRIVA